MNSHCSPQARYMYITLASNLLGGAKIRWSLRPRFESHRGTWVPVLRMGPYKSRSRVTVDVGMQNNSHCCVLHMVNFTILYAKSHEC
jgi:hypothetical protein